MAKVLALSPKYPPHTGGSATYFSSLVSSLSDDCRFFVITSYHSEKDAVTIDNDGNKIYRVLPLLEGYPSLIRANLQILVSFLFSAYLFLVKDIDLAHTHSTSYATPSLALTALLSRVPIIYDCQDLEFPKAIFNINTPSLCFSPSSRIDSIIKSYGFVKEDRIVRVPIVNPPYVEKFRADLESKTETGERLDVVYVGAVRELKNVDKIVEAVLRMRNEGENIEMKIVGNIKKPDEITKVTEIYSDEEGIRVMGEMGHREALSQIRDSDILVHASSYEAGPRTVLEAMEIGTPVVSTPVGIVKDIVKDGENGLLTSSNPNDIKRSIKKLKNPSLRKRCIRNGWETIEIYGRGSAESNVRKTYQSILKTQ